MRTVWLVMVADADARGEVLGSVASRKAVICVYLQPTRLPRGGSAMTADDDLPAQRSVLRLSVATAGVAWYVILFSIGLIGCWNAYVHFIHLLYSCSLTPLSQTKALPAPTSFTSRFGCTRKCPRRVHITTAERTGPKSLREPRIYVQAGIS